MAKPTPTMVYPLQDVFVPGIPHIETEAPSAAAAAELEATGAFTTDPNHERRLATEPAPAETATPDTTPTTEPAPAGSEE